MVAGRKHISLQYEWTEKLKKEPYNCTFTKMEYFISLPEKDFYVDVYGKNNKDEEFIIEIGSLSAMKYDILKKYFKERFIYIPFEKVDDKVTSKTRKISIRMPTEMNDILNKLCEQNGKNYSQNINYLAKMGMSSISSMEKTRIFLKEQEQLMMGAIGDDRLQNLGVETKALERDQYRCRKCGSKTNIMEITLPSDLTGRTIAGLDSESKITLCKNCNEELKKFIPKRYELERFIEWYYKDY